MSLEKFLQRAKSYVAPLMPSLLPASPPEKLALCTHCVSSASQPIAGKTHKAARELTGIGDNIATLAIESCGCKALPGGRCRCWCLFFSNSDVVIVATKHGA